MTNCLSEKRHKWENPYINCSVPARNWKWRGATLEKGHFSTSKTM